MEDDLTEIVAYAQHFMSEFVSFQPNSTRPLPKYRINLRAFVAYISQIWP
jgi:hypothetical protein